MQLIRGDTYKFKFQRIDAYGNVIHTLAPQLFFTVKRNAGDKNFIFQKTIQDITFDDEGYYHVVIEPADTDGMKFGNYVYDIEVITSQYKKTISIGSFTVAQEVTWAVNEV